MRYFGGKQRIAQRIADAIQPVVDAHSAYVEPFVGSANVMSRIRGTRRIASDSNMALITMWRAWMNGWRPQGSISIHDYADLKAKNDPTDPMTAFAGFGMSFAGKWFAGFADGGADRDYAENASNSLQKKAKSLAGVQWLAEDYRDLTIPSDSVIYCDPPYAGTTQYGAVEPFHQDDFWQWCRDQHRNGHQIFVSEYAAPNDFVSVLDIRTKTDIRDKSGAKQPRLERLFVPRDGIKSKILQLTFALRFLDSALRERGSTS